MQIDIGVGSMATVFMNPEGTSFQSFEEVEVGYVFSVSEDTRSYRVVIKNHEDDSKGTLVVLPKNQR